MSTDPAPDEAILSAAFDWFNRHRSGEMTAIESRAFEVWLERDPQHESLFRSLERRWSLLGDLAEHPQVMVVQEEVDGLVSSAQRRRVVAAVAAGVGLAAIGGWAVTNSDGFIALAGFKPPPVQEFRTALGQQRAVTLADGSILTLDTDTLLRTRLSAHERQIELLRGQASFKVAKDKSRPFIVTAGGKTVRATGTTFDVRIEPGRFEVTLIEGRIRVQEQGAKREDAPLADMRQGWRLAIGEDARWRMEPVDLMKATSWHDGMLSFHRDRLADAVAEMNRYSKRKIVFRGEPPGTFVLGMFAAGDVDSFVDAVEMNKLARVSARTDEKIELVAR